MKLNVPNIISLARGAVSPIFFVMVLSTSALSVEISCILFVVAALSDYFDGWLARKYQDVTESGKFFDPLADKLLTTAAFIAFVFMRLIPVWMVFVVLIRDFSTTLLRVIGDSYKMPIKTSYSAKLKTSLQMIFILYVLTLVFLKNSGIGSVSIVKINLLLKSPFIYYSMLILTVFTVWTAIEYVLQNKMLFSLLFSCGKKGGDCHSAD
jgi:CDP-diacylglycerol---glycerol-3-phosphate 3-phosphatidyltransferase